MKLYPVMLNLEGRRVIVIGGGSVAVRKARDLLDNDALVTVISPTFIDEFDELKKRYAGRLDLQQRSYRKGDLQGALIVFSATNNRELNRVVYNEETELNIFINAVDDPGNCTFTVPSSCTRGDLVVTVSTGGVSPALSARMRREIEKYIPESIEDTLAALKLARNHLQNDAEFANISPDQRGKILKQIVNDDDLLDELVNCFHSGTVTQFLVRITADNI